MASPSAYSDSGVARRPTTLPLAPSEFFYRSLPGLGDILGARVLAEFGDDPARYADAKARKNYSGMSPITKASGVPRQESGRISACSKVGMVGLARPRCTSRGRFQDSASCGLIVLNSIRNSSAWLVRSSTSTMSSR